MMRMLFKITAKGLGRHVSDLCNFFQGDILLIMLHYIIVNIGNANALMIAIALVGLEGQRLQVFQRSDLLQQVQELEKLLYTAGIAHGQHLFRYTLHAGGRDAEAHAVMFYKILQIFYFGYGKEGRQLFIKAEEDVQRMFGLLLILHFGGLAFEYVGLIGPDPINLILMEQMHAVVYDQGALALEDPGQLHFVMAMEMGIKVDMRLLLGDNGLIIRHRQGKL